MSTPILLTHPLPLARTTAFAVLLGAAFLAAPAAPAHAETPHGTAMQPAQASPPARHAAANPVAS